MKFPAISIELGPKTLAALAQIVADASAVQAQTARLKTSADALKQAVDSTTPKKEN